MNRYRKMQAGALFLALFSGTAANADTVTITHDGPDLWTATHATIDGLTLYVPEFVFLWTGDAYDDREVWDYQPTPISISMNAPDGETLYDKYYNDGALEVVRSGPGAPAESIPPDLAIPSSGTYQAVFDIWPYGSPIAITETVYNDAGASYWTANFSAAPVPEPSTWAMLLIGFGTIVLFGRRAIAGVKADS